MPKSDILHERPAVFFSPADQRPNPQASPHFAAKVTRASPCAEVTYLLGSHTNRSGKAEPACNIIVGSYEFARRLTRPTSVLDMHPPPSSSGRNRSPPVGSKCKRAVNPIGVF